MSDERASIIRRLSLCTSLAVMLISPGCGETLFRSDFDPTPANQPPAATQPVGTAATVGNVIVVAPPVEPSGKWVRISRPIPDSNVAAFQGNFSEIGGEGEFTFTTTVFMPTGAGAATIQFERFGQPVGDPEAFLHLDLMPDNTVRIDDDNATKFGTFPRDQPFIVQVTLDIAVSSANAHIVLSGAGASGTADRVITPALLNLAQQFGAVRLWMGFPHTGRFEATNIVVRRD